MTGAYLRINRDNKWQNIEVEHLTPEERRLSMANRDQEELMRWMDMLCEELVKCEKLFDELVEDGVLGKVDKP